MSDHELPVYALARWARAGYPAPPIKSRMSFVCLMVFVATGAVAIVVPIVAGIAG